MNNHQSTYNPIGNPSETIPSSEPGFTIVRLHQGQAKLLSQTAQDVWLEPIFGHSDYRVILGILGTFAFSLLVTLMMFGKWIALFVLLLVLVLVIFIKLHRNSAQVSRFFGPPPVYYSVDIAAHPVRDRRRVQVADIGVFADVEIEYTAKVVNAEKVVCKGIRDVREYLSGLFYTEIDRVAVHGKLSDKLDGMRQKLNLFSQNNFTYKEFSIRNITLQVHLDSDLALDARREAAIEIKKLGLRAEQSLNDLERSYFQKLVDDEEALIAEFLRPGANLDRLNIAIGLLHERGTRYFDMHMQKLKLALESGALEPHHFEQAQLDYLKNLVYNTGQSTSPRPSPQNPAALADHSDREDADSDQEKEKTS